MDLDNLMSIDHVVRVLPDGTVTDKTPDGKPLGVYAPEVYCDYDGPFAEASITKEHDRDMVKYLADQGWHVADGWSGQDRYSGPIMHPSEYIGGALADHIRETPGYWVALSVEIHPKEDDPEYDDGNGESESAGWIVAHREITEDN
jgi:hypothetical protein